MQQLKLIIDFLHQNLPKTKIDVIKKILQGDELIMYEGILLHSFSKDIDAASMLFNIKSSNPKFKKIKESLSEKLYSFIFLLEPNIKGATNEFTNIVESYKAAFVSQIMYNTGNINKVIPYLELKLRLAEKTHSNQAISIISNYLMNYYTLGKFEKQKFKDYNNLFIKSTNDTYYEAISSSYYTIAQSYFGKNKQVDVVKFIPEMLKYIEELRPFVGKVSSLLFHRNYYTLVMMCFHVKKEYKNVVETCDEFLDFINKWSMKSFAIRKSVINHKIEHLMLLGEYEKAITLLKDLLEEESEGTISWFNTNRFLILALINLKDLKLAYDTSINLVNHKNYKNYKSGLKYLNGLIHLYLNIISSMGFIKSKITDSYNVKKFIKEYPNLSKDKSAMNIPIIIAQLFEAIISDNQDEVLDRLDALKKYSSRYITKNNNTRSNCFINMLIEVVKQNYHPVAIERHTKKYLKKMTSITTQMSSEAAEVEFIPYEYQWELLMTYLLNRKKKIRSGNFQSLN